jgi:RNA polymerase sigma-70 factor (ECF subfamily)
MSGTEEFADAVAPLRQELLVHCYRLLGSSHDAEDALQDALVRAWRAFGRFEGRSSFRTWLYAIATNACLREIERRGRRLVPVDLGPAADPADGLVAPRSDTLWLGPLPDAGITWGASPADAVYEQREAVELAFVVALQRLPASQRAVLVLRDVLVFSAAETAEVLGTTVDSVTSALHRARTSLKTALPVRSQQTVRRELGDDRLRAVLGALVAAWERNDVRAVVALLADDVEFAMPPHAEWYRGRDDVAAFLARTPLHPDRRWRVEATSANGQPAIALAIWSEQVGAFLSHGLSVLTVDSRGITGFTSFLDPGVVPPMPEASAVVPVTGGVRA